MEKQAENCFKDCWTDLVNTRKSEWRFTKINLNKPVHSKSAVVAMVTIVRKLSTGMTASLETWIYLHSTCRQRYGGVSMVRCVTYGGPVFSHKPQVVSEEWKNADAEHGRHKKEKQDMEFGVRLWQVTLRKRGERERRAVRQRSITRETRATGHSDTGTLGSQG